MPELLSTITPDTAGDASYIGKVLFLLTAPQGV